MTSKEKRGRTRLTKWRKQASMLVPTCLEHFPAFGRRSPGPHRRPRGSRGGSRLCLQFCRAASAVCRRPPRFPVRERRKNISENEGCEKARRFVPHVQFKPRTLALESRDSRAVSQILPRALFEIKAPSNASPQLPPLT